MKPPGENSSGRYQTNGSMRRSMGLVFSGGGARAAYQVGVLKALRDAGILSDDNIKVITGTSIGSINGILFGAMLKHGLDRGIEVLEQLWRERTFENTLGNSHFRTFLRALQVGIARYTAPGPDPTSNAIFNISRFHNQLEDLIVDNGGLDLRNDDSSLEAVGIMTTLEGERRKALLFVSAQERLERERLQGAHFRVHYVKSLRASHGFASAALPSVLPPVDMDLKQRSVRLVDGGICDNVPVDPAVRLGADEVCVLDCSGRAWWFDHYGEPHDTRPEWEVPASDNTFCFAPQKNIKVQNRRAFGPLLKAAVGSSSKSFISAVGVIWPIYKLLKFHMGEDLAFEVMSYAALHPEYAEALIECGYEEATEVLQSSISVGDSDSSRIAV